MSVLNEALQANVSILFSSLPAVRDANTDAIHHARIATRRLRAVVPLIRDFSDPLEIDGVLDVLRTAGRALGRARDTDVMLEQLSALERKLTAAPIAVAAMRHQVLRRQIKQRRRMIRKIDGIDFGPLTRLASQWRRVRTRSAPQVAAIEGAVVDRIEELRDAVTEGSGVYFPKRSHRVRIGAKKLRYELELVPDPGVKRAMKRLRRTQGVLGSIQDRRALIEEMSDLPEIPDTERQAMRALLTAESLDLHREYLAMRDDLLESLDDIARQAAGGAWHRHVGHRWLAVGAVAGPAVVALLAGRAVAQRFTQPTRSDRALEGQLVRTDVKFVGCEP
jgi:CHAD domain-containing protein